MDWAVGAGYSGLYTNVNKRESAKQDLATLSVLNQEVKKQKLEQEQAQLKEQAYYDQISKTADTLLASDRNKINEKAKGMSSMVRNHLKQYGGDLTKFFENGGHKIMGDYKNAIVNSEEASQYMDNKKNMERILDMQQKGFGHLLNPTDMFNLQNYQKNGGGKITYTGMLSEIKMPDPNSEIWGKEMSVDRILSNEGNYTKVYANYKLTYPDAPEPTQEDIKQFASAQYSGMLGTNWQKPMADRKTAYDEFSDQRNFAQDVHKDERNFEYGEYRDSVGDYQWQKNYNLQKEQQEFEQEQSALEAMYKTQGGAQKSSSSPTGYVDSQGNPISKEDAESTNSFMYDVNVMNSFLNGEVNSLADIYKAPQIFNSQFGEVLEDNNIGGSGSGGFLKTEWTRGLANDYHRLAGSKTLLTGEIASNILSKTPLFKFDQDGNIKNLDLDQNRDMYSANGVNIGKWSSDSPKVGSSNILTGENFATEVNKSTFKVKGVMTGFIGKDKSGNDMLITDIVKEGDGGKFVVKDKASKEYSDRNYDSKAKPRSVMVVAIQNEKGQTFYKPVDGNVEQNIFASMPSLNIGAIKKGKGLAAGKAAAILGKEKESEMVYRDLKRDPKSMAKIRQQVQVASGNPNTAKFDAAAISYYTHVRNLTGGNVNSLIDKGDFYQMVQAATDTPELRQQFNSLMKNPKATSYDLVKFIADHTEYEGRDSWINNLKYIERVKNTK